jgi:hypothetical protein
MMRLYQWHVLLLVLVTTICTHAMQLAKLWQCNMQPHALHHVLLT